MDGDTLTGRDAVEAIGLCMRLGAADARFDSRKVTQAVRTSAGRARLSGALAAALRLVRPMTTDRQRRRSSGRSAPCGTLAAAAAPARPARPARAV